MKNIKLQSENLLTITKPLIRGFSFFLITLLLGVFMFNLLLGYGGINSYKLLILPLAFFPSFYIASFLIIVFFLRHQERSKRAKYVLLVIGLDLVYRVVLFFTFGDGSWGSLGLMFYGILEIATLVIATLVFSVLSRFESNKQMIIVWTVFGILFVLNIVQYFGILRPGLVE